MSLYVREIAVDAVQWRPCRSHPMVRRMPDEHPLAGRHAFIGKNSGGYGEAAIIENGDWIVTELNSGKVTMVSHAEFTRNYNPVRNS